MIIMEAKLRNRTLFQILDVKYKWKTNGIQITPPPEATMKTLCVSESFRYETRKTLYVCKDRAMSEASFSALGAKMAPSASQLVSGLDSGSPQTSQNRDFPQFFPKIEGRQ